MSVYSNFNNFLCKIIYDYDFTKKTKPFTIIRYNTDDVFDTYKRQLCFFMQCNPRYYV